MGKVKIFLLAALLTAASLLSLTGDFTANTVHAANYVRPFGDKAPWNRPVKDALGNQLISTHSNSDTLRSLHWNYSPNREAGNFNLNAGYTGFTYPVYDVSTATGTYPVMTTSGYGNMNGQTMPWNPAWQPADDSDGQVIVIDPANGYEWDLWRVQFDNNTNTITAQNANLVLSSKDNISVGIDPYPYFGNYSIKENGFIPSRGAGIQYLAMLVGPEEIRQGVIRHALSMPIKNTSYEQFVAPATKLEHEGEGQDNGTQIPEGTRFALNVTDQEIDNWLNALPSDLPNRAETVKSARIIAKAMRDYGWFITDTSGGAHIQLEDYHSAGDDWVNLGLGYRNVSGGIEMYTASNGKTYPQDLLDGLMTESRIYALVSSDLYPPSSDPMDVETLADAYVMGGTPEMNYGMMPMLRIKDAPSEAFDRISYFKFDLSNVSGNISSVKLRVYCSALFNGTPTYAKAFRVDTDSWLEYEINWNNRPALGAQEGSQVTFSATGWYEFDVTSYVNSQLANKDRVITIALADNSVANKSIDLGSKEGINRPVLRIDTTP